MRFRKCGTCLFGICGAISSVAAQPTASYTYQGQVKHGEFAVNGQVDLEFSLWNAPTGGTQIGDEIEISAVTVSNGLFQVALNFDIDELNGARWLAISIREPAGVGVYLPILPRQQITSSPYSLQTRGIFVSDAKQVGFGTNDPTAKMEVVTASAPGRLESGIRTHTDDAPNDHFQIRNWTNWDGIYYPFLWGHHQSDDRNALQFLATTNATGDTGAEAMMSFKAFLSDRVAMTGPINNRPLFSWVDFFFLQMTMTANGRLGIGNGAPETALHLGLPADSNHGIFLAKSGTDLGTRLSVHGTNNQVFAVDIDPNNGTAFEQFEVTYDGGSPVFVVDDDGDVGIGTSSPEVPLHIVGGSDATLSSGGYIQARGAFDSTVVLDDDEILGRINDGNLVLEINQDGGTVVFGGDIDIDVTVVRSPSVGHVVWAICANSQRVLSGGCEGGGGKVEISRPTDTGNAWLCQFASTSTDPDADGFAWAICANVE